MSETPTAGAWIRRAWLVLVLCAVAALSQAHADTGDAQLRALRQTLDRHLVAINARDLDALVSTVTADEPLTTILPNGKVLATRQAYRQLHVDWFEETDWRMVFDVQDVRMLGDTGIARVHYDSQARDATGGYASRRRAILTLVFARERGEWRLVYDQNTVVPAQSD